MSAVDKITELTGQIDELAEKVGKEAVTEARTGLAERLREMALTNHVNLRECMAGGEWSAFAATVSDRDEFLDGIAFAASLISDLDFEF